MYVYGGGCFKVEAGNVAGMNSKLFIHSCLKIFLAVGRFDGSLFKIRMINFLAESEIGTPLGKL